MDHIPTRNFSHTIDFEERWKIISQYKGQEWEYAKTINSDSNKITRSAIEIAENMKNHLGIELFPCIKTIATKGFDIGGGTYAFMMIGKNSESYYFDMRARFYKAKNGKYELDGNLIYRLK